VAQGVAIRQAGQALREQRFADAAMAAETWPRWWDCFYFIPQVLCQKRCVRDTCVMAVRETAGKGMCVLTFLWH
jgi:hypothetical protein